MPKKPQDITVRDRQSLNKKILKLSDRVKRLEVELKRQGKALKAIQNGKG